MKSFIQKSILYIARAIMNFIYFFIKLFPMQKNKILMMSRQSNEPSIDFKLLEEEIKNRNKQIKIVMLCRKIPKKFWKRIGYCFYLIKCMYHLATSKICIVNGYVIPVSILHHKKKLTIVQIWHAMGAIKQFGLQITDKKEGSHSSVAKIMKMHQNYTNVICTSKTTREFYAQAFDIEADKILVLGMPRIDYLLGKNGVIDQKVNKIYEQYPDLKEKENILYVPTFRKGKKIDLNQIINCFDEKKYNLIIRLHPLDHTCVEKRFLIDNKYQTLELLKIADYVITDYSAIAFEAAVLRKKIFFYLYDIQEYQKTRGLNIDLKQEMSNVTSSNIQEIARKIEEHYYDEKELEAFRQKYVETSDIENTKRIVDYLLEHLEI